MPHRFIQTVTRRPPPRCEGRKRVQVDSVPSMVDASSPSPPPLTVPVRRGNGLPVVAVHGNGVDHRLLLAADEALSEAGGLERIYLDLPGFGCTPPLSGTGGLPELADWLVEHVIQLVGTGTFALLGNSLGGLLARHIRANLPEQVVGMALIAPVVNPDRASRTLPPFHAVEKDETLLESLSAADRDDFTEMTSRQTRSTWGRFATYALPGIRAADTRAMERLGERYHLESDVDARAGVFTGSALFLTGRQDHVAGYADQLDLARTWYPNATYACLHGAGHNVHLDCPETAHALLRGWASDLPR